LYARPALPNVRGHRRATAMMTTGETPRGLQRRIRGRSL